MCVCACVRVCVRVRACVRTCARAPFGPEILQAGTVKGLKQILETLYSIRALTSRKVSCRCKDDDMQ